MLFNLTTFFVELIVDWIFIYILKKPDPIRLRHRVLMITGIMLILIIFNDYRGQQIVKGLCVAVLPYCYFDYALNAMRKKKWYYLSSTNNKLWDETLRKMNPYALLFLRTLAAAILIGLIIWL